MRIRNATEQDLDRIMEIYESARRFMAEHGNPDQWGATNWPPEALIRKDISDGNSYVCLNDTDHVIGTFFFTLGADIEPTYRKITEGRWLDDSPYGVVHRIASDGSEKGVGAFCIGWAYDQCGHLRIDTHNDNTVMQNLVRKLGFVHCGTIHVEEDNAPRLAYEKSEAIAGLRRKERMIYYQDEELVIRNMEEGDARVFYEEYLAQGWHPDLSVYTQRLKDQAEGKCIALTAVYRGHPAGSVYVYLTPHGGPFKDKGWPEIHDFSVLQKYQRRGIGGRLMDAAEKIAAQHADTVWLGVGLCDSYGSAQRMYIKRGFIPDGSGVWYQGKQCVQYETVCTVDDDLILYLSKKLPGDRP